MKRLEKTLENGGLARRCRPWSTQNQSWLPSAHFILSLPMDAHFIRTNQGIWSNVLVTIATIWQTQFCASCICSIPSSLGSFHCKSVPPHWAHFFYFDFFLASFFFEVWLCSSFQSSNCGNQHAWSPLAQSWGHSVLFIQNWVFSMPFSAYFCSN